MAAVQRPEEALRGCWERLTVRSSPDHAAVAARRSIIEDVVARHAEPVRHYHTASHVMFVLEHVEQLLPHASSSLDGDAIRAAALFHDVVYDPMSSSNEHDSAKIAAIAMRSAGWSDQRVVLVAALIEATAAHDDDSSEAAVLLDADLAILGSEPSAYARYVAGVRAEFAHVSDDAWRTGRATVLQSFLGRPRIFRTPTMAEQREAAARANLTDELAQLRG